MHEDNRRTMWMTLRNIVIATAVLAVPMFILSRDYFLGYTTCIGGTRVTVNSALSGKDSARVLAHEHAHVAQIERFGCLPYVVRTLLPWQRGEFEREAYCAEVLWDVDRGATWDEAFRTVVADLTLDDWFFRHAGPDGVDRLGHTCARIRGSPDLVMPRRTP